MYPDEKNGGAENVSHESSCDSRNEQFGAPASPPQGERGCSESGIDPQENRLHPGGLESAEKELASRLEETPPEALAGILVGQTREWSGLLPRPEDFREYPPDVQKHIVAWTDAQVLGSSARADKLADAEIRNTLTETRLSFIIHIASIGAAFVGVAIFNQTAALGLLSIPGISVVVNWHNKRNER